MEKTISVRRTTITFSIWDLGGQREFVNMLPLVCNDAVAILFMFDLSRKSTLNSVKEWYRQARGFNKVSVDFTVVLGVGLGALQGSPFAMACVGDNGRNAMIGIGRWSESVLGIDRVSLFRQQFHSSLARNSTHSRPFHEMSKKRSQSRCVALPRSCCPLTLIE